MNTRKTEIRFARAQQVTVTEDSLIVDLIDGRTISVPIVWYPRLLHGTMEERNNWELIGDGEGIHWPDIDEDISVEGLLVGYPSGESQRSLERWLEAREGIYDMPVLVTSFEQVVQNIRAYQKEHYVSEAAHPELVHAWYYLPDEDIAGPSKFVGYANMTAFKYDRWHADGMDGGRTEQNFIKQEWFRELSTKEQTYSRAFAAVKRLLTKGKSPKNGARFYVPTTPGKE